MKPDLFGRVEREVQLEHVHAGLAEEAEHAPVGVLLHEGEDIREWNVAFPGDPSRLDPGVGRGDVRVEARSGGGDRLDRNRGAGREAVLAPVEGDPGADVR